jgi:lysozyme family protein
MEAGMRAKELELIDRVIGVEGGYADHPADRGGPTRWGVTQTVAHAYGYTGDMRVLPRETAVEIYFRRYWLDPGFDRVAALAPGLAAELFDTAVNMGTGVACTFLQRALNVLNRQGADYPDLTADGRIGSITIKALATFLKVRGSAGERVLTLICDALQGARYVAIAEANPSQEAFVYGWIANRTGEAA